MSFTIGWYIPNQVLVVSLYGDVDNHDLLRLSYGTPQRPHPMATSAHIIYDLSDMVTFPLSLESMLRTIRATNSRTKHWSLVVGTNKAVQMMSSVLLQKRGKNLRTFTGFADSIAFLQQTEHDIDWSNRSPDLP